MAISAEDILIKLGYSSVYTSEFLASIMALPAAIQTRLESLVTSIDAIDNALASAPLDSMATKVDKLEVSYSQHIALLKKEGSRMLHEISALTLVPLLYDRYLQRSPLTVKTNRLNVVSYW